MKRLFRPLRRIILQWDIGHLENRIREDQRAVDVWPTQTKPAHLRELARLKGELDRIEGRKSVVNWSLTPRAPK
jgi:hypothetical protein